jgi:hypothetical protein
MQEFSRDTIKAVQAVLEEVCRHMPPNSNAARTFVASRILQCAGTGDQTYKGLLVAAHRALIDRFCSIDPFPRNEA